jgi:hypothetical protein
MSVVNPLHRLYRDVPCSCSRRPLPSFSSAHPSCSSLATNAHLFFTLSNLLCHVGLGHPIYKDANHWRFVLQTPGRDTILTFDLRNNGVDPTTASGALLVGGVCSSPLRQHSCSIAGARPLRQPRYRHQLQGPTQLLWPRHYDSR